MGTTGRALVAPLLLVAALSACGGDPTVMVADESPASPGATPTASSSAVEGSAGGPASAPSAGAPDEAPAQAPDDEPDETTAPAAPRGDLDLDGDGRADRVTLVEVPDMGWSFDVELADGRATSAPLPAEHVVRDDVAVVGAVDLDGDGADEVLVRTLRAVGGENAVVFRLDGDGVWLLRGLEGAPFELSTSGGMTGPRSYSCVDGEVLTRESERQADGTYRAMTTRWTVNGHVVGALGGARDDALSADEVSLDPSTCQA